MSSNSAILKKSRAQLPFSLSLVGIFCLFFLTAKSQPDFFRTSFPVTENNVTLKYPWTGGLNNAQFSAADINNDGIQDLVIFDRSGDKVLTFINHGTANTFDYEYAPEYEEGFAGFQYWMLMDDFDCDGIPDVFTSFPGKIEYYKGSYTPENKIEFEYVTFFQFTDNQGFPLNIYTSQIDIPAIVDVNNDGDLDVLAFNILGGQLEYYENQSQELTGTCGDTVWFKLVDDCWGDFFESVFGGINLLANCGSLRHANNSHSGSTILAFDEDGDGDKELILGDIGFTNLNKLTNGGTPDSAKIVSVDTSFPSYNVPVNLQVFPAAFHLDVDNDGLKDLLVTPNQQGSAENYHCIWYYKNTGSQTQAVFEYQTDAFIVDQSIDVGEGAYPVFFDYNKDGLIDLVVGNYGYYVNSSTYSSQLALYENTGTALEPAFTLITRDYAGLSNYNINAVHPSFGDMDGDGDLDMIIGDWDGKLHYFEDTSSIGNPASFSLIRVNYFNIDVGQFSAPFIYDVNKDGLLDIIVGEKAGNVNYFENTGSSASPVFSTLPTNSSFGAVDVRTPGFIDGYSRPIITRLDTSSHLYLLCGSEGGTIWLYRIDPNQLYSGSFNLFTNGISKIDQGKRVAISVADLNGDGKLEMAVGNYRGGLAMFTQQLDPCAGLAKPQLNHANAATLCRGEILSVNQGYHSYQWSTGDSANFTTINGTANYFVKVTDLMGCQSFSDTVFITIFPEVRAGFSFDADSLQLDLFNNSTGAITAFNWDFGDGNTSTLPNLVHIYDTAGLYRVRLMVTDTCQQHDTLSLSIGMGVTCVSLSPPLTPIQWSGTNPVCSGEVIQVNPGYTYYLWSDGSNSPSMNVTTTADYFVEVVDTNGCIGHSDTVFMDVRPLPKAGFYYSIDSLAVTFSDSSTGDLNNHLWNFGDGKTGSQQNPLYTYDTAGLYTISLVVTDTCGFKDTAFATIWVNIPCAVLSPPLTPVNWSGINPVCAGEIISTHQGYASYQWSTGDATFNTEVTTTGSYNVQVTDSNGCMAVTEPVYIETFPEPHADFLMKAYHLVVEFTDVSLGNIEDYHWDFGDGNNGIHANPVHEYNSLDEYFITLIVSDVCDFKDTLARVLNLKDSVTFIRESQWEKPFTVAAVPNPFKESVEIFVSGVTKQPYRLVIYDLVGRDIANLEGTTDTPLKVHSEKFSPGIYFYRVILRDNRSGAGKLVAN